MISFLARSPSLLTNSGNFPICSSGTHEEANILPPDSSIAPGSSVDDQQGPYHLLIQKRLYSRVNPLLRGYLCPKVLLEWLNFVPGKYAYYVVKSHLLGVVPFFQ